MSLARPRRLLLALLAISAIFVLILYFYSPVRNDIFSMNGQPSKLPDEIFGLLHFVTSPDEAGRVISAVGDPTHDDAGNDPFENGVELGDVTVAPHKPMAMAWYALGSIAKAPFRARMRSASAGGGWEERLRVLREEYPVVVFSKSYCPYSKRAKRLLEAYDLLPAPKVVEVDLRADAAHIKTLLTRLTGRSTFPNVILNGHSLGGSDDLMRLHEEDQLRELLANAGVMARWTGKGGEEMLL